MYNIRLAFLPEDQHKFLEEVRKKSKLEDKVLAKLAGVHPRTYSDWKRGKYNIPLSVASSFIAKFNILLPEEEKVLIDRWIEIKKQASIKGGLATIQKYGGFATDEGRKKGGRISWQKRKSDLEILKKYSHIIIKPEESVVLAELMGILLGDGGLTHSQCCVYLSSETDIDFSLYVQEVFSRLFNIMPAIYKSKRAKVLRVSVSSVYLVKYLLEKGLILGNKVHLQAGVPGWINKDKEYIKACIRGLVDTDGCFIIHKYKVKGKEYKYPKMIFSNRSIPLLDFVYKGLSELGFSPKRYAMKHVWLLNHHEVKRYLEEIGTNNYKPTIKLILKSMSND